MGRQQLQQWGGAQSRLELAGDLGGALQRRDEPEPVHDRSHVVHHGQRLRHLAQSFDSDASYTLTIATANGGIANFNAASFNLITTNFANAYDGVWSLTTVWGTDLVLGYDNTTLFTWTNYAGGVWNTSNWTNSANLAATPLVNRTNLVLVFGSSGSTAYTATNNFGDNFVVKRLVLTNSSLSSPPRPSRATRSTLPRSIRGWSRTARAPS